MTGLDAYNQLEWDIVRAKNDPRRLVPPFDFAGLVVLDVGCGSGQTLMAEEIAAAKARHGIDIDAGAIERGRQAFPALNLSTAPAERIPYPDATFDLVFSRVALPYTHLPSALAEIHRVAKPGGRVWLALHPWRMERERLFEAARVMSVKSLASRAPILVNSMAQHLAGRPLPLPRFLTQETWQTARGMRLMLARSGFGDIVILRDPTLIATARR